MEVEPVEVSQQDIDEALVQLQLKYAVLNPVERAAQLGDLVTMAIKERAGDEILAEDESMEYELAEVDEDSAEPDLTTPLIGLSAGDEKEFTVAYPETADARFAGRDVTVSVKVHSVKERELYPLDDDFAQTVGDFDTLEQLREKLAEDLLSEKEQAADRELGQEALEQLIASAERLEWPNAVEEEEIDRVLEEQDRRLQRDGLSLDTYLSMQKKTREQLREEFRPAVQDQLRHSMVLGKLIELEGLSLAGHEVTGRIDVLSSLAGERGAELREALTTPDSVKHIANDLLTSKALDRLVQIVKGEAEAEEIERAEAETQTEAEPGEASETEPANSE
jgi:trigger factor